MNDIATNWARLRRIGLKEHVLAQAALHGMDDEALQLRRVVEVQREHLLLHDGEATHTARALPRLIVALQDEADALAVGDWVLAARDTWGQWWVQQRLPPQSQIARRLHDGRDKVARVVIVSNVDTALLTMGLDHDFSLRRLERYVALVRLAGVEAVVVLTKADLCADAGSRLAEVQAVLPPGVAAVAVDGQDAASTQALAPWLAPGCSLVLLGSSGAGKSTLTNTLCGAPLQDTGGTRKGDGRGRHTTTTRSLHVATAGACIIDTPGLRTLRLDTDEAALGAVFDDVSALALQCRFRDCRHEAEPGCAVREGVPAERLRSFHKLQREARRDTLSALERQQQVSEWKARGRAGKARAKEKRG
jgi:ribosome biogenesis GTPase / thiamine phosphate phosphatase